MNNLGADNFVDLVVALKVSPPPWPTVVAGVFVFISLTPSSYLLFEHLSTYKNPEMIIKAVTAVLAVIVEAFDVYCESDFKWGRG
ncbi:hypothetical protein L2E82_45109 [Cichorium intybus]|uniref:Uncharacterized protein n=1 Tax=Cichorium intybus TaxID=13427 RepID=A0ACB8ZT20_CICIN|nr:hypothetical protein L2E82_45109 [Cichorium intybus]